VPERARSPLTVRFPTNASFYKALLDRISDGVCFVDSERRIVFWNEAAYRLTGYTPDEVLGRYCPEGILCQSGYDGEGLCTEHCPLTATLTDGAARRVQVFLRHKLERRVPVTARIEPIRKRDGLVVGGVQIFSADSARQDARRRVEDMERLASSIR
jgi:PAS domain S-box-containing protein